MKNIIKYTFVSYVLLIFSFSIQAQTWHTYFGDTLRFTQSECPTHCVWVDRIIVDNDSLFISGAFANAGDLGLYCLAKWNNYKWYNLGLTSANDDIYDLIKYDNKLFAGGGGTWYPNYNEDLKYLCYWDGSTWDRPGEVRDAGQVNGFIEYRDTLFLCGRFTGLGGVYGKSVKAYYNDEFIYIGDLDVAQATTYAVYNDELLVGTRYLGLYKRFCLSRWERDLRGPNGTINAFAVDSINNFLYAGGAFVLVDDTVVSRCVTMFDGFKWQSLDGGVEGDVQDHAMTIYRGDLYIGGYFRNTANGLEVNSIARWDGDNWHALGKGANALVNTLTVFQDTLIVGGRFYQVGDSLTAYGIAKWYQPPDTSCNYLRPVLYSYEEFGVAKDTFKLVNGEAKVKFYNNNAYTDIWHWDFGDGNYENTKEPVHIFTEPGEYNVQLRVVQDQCNKTLNRTVYIEQGANILEVENNHLLNLFPNPSKTKFTAEINLSNYNNVELRIYSSGGQHQASQSINKTQTEIDISNWQRGVYICNLFVNGKLVKTEKLVLE